MEYRINSAYRSATNEIIHASNVFRNQRDSYKFWDQIIDNNETLICLECLQQLTISRSKNKNVFFKHKPNFFNCALKDSIYRKKELRQIEIHNTRSESDLHKKVKTDIYNSLIKRNIDARLEETITYADSFRRADVFINNYLGKKIAIEIQISILPYEYIRRRTKFYKEAKIYPLWIIHEIELTRQNTFELDIKYTNAYETFFEANFDFGHLVIFNHYKKPFATLDHEIHEKWEKKIVTLSNLCFDEATFDIYYSNTIQLKSDLKLKIIENIKLQEVKAALEQKKALELQDQKESVKTMLGYSFFTEEIFDLLKAKLTEIVLAKIKANSALIEKNIRFFHIAFSILLNKSIGFRFENLKQIIIYLFDHKPEYVDIIVSSLYNNNFESLLKVNDKKGTIQRKFEEYNESPGKVNTNGELSILGEIISSFV